MSRNWSMPCFATYRTPLVRPRRLSWLASRILGTCFAIIAAPFAVDREVVLATEGRVVDAGDRGLGDVEVGHVRSAFSAIGSASSLKERCAYGTTLITLPGFGITASSHSVTFGSLESSGAASTSDDNSPLRSAFRCGTPRARARTARALAVREATRRRPSGLASIQSATLSSRTASQRLTASGLLVLRALGVLGVDDDRLAALLAGAEVRRGHEDQVVAAHVHQVDPGGRRVELRVDLHRIRRWRR